MISVIIPCYNAALTIARTLDSIFAQEGVELEVLAVDDGSTDNTREILENHRPSLRVLTGPNEGVAAARERAAALVRGDAVQYVDADDFLAPGTIAARWELMNLRDADVVYTDWQEFRETSPDQIAWGLIRKTSLEVADSQAACATSFWAPPAAILYNRRIVHKLNWRRDMRIIQDARYAFDAARAGARFAHVANVGAYYRVSEASLSRRDPRRFVLECFLNAAEISALWESDGDISPARLHALSEMWSYVTSSMFYLQMAEFPAAYARLRAISSGRRIRRIDAYYYLTRLTGHSLATRVIELLRRTRNSFRIGRSS